MVSTAVINSSYWLENNSIVKLFFCRDAEPRLEVMNPKTWAITALWPAMAKPNSPRYTNSGLGREDLVYLHMTNRRKWSSAVKWSWSFVWWKHQPQVNWNHNKTDITANGLNIQSLNPKVYAHTDKWGVMPAGTAHFSQQEQSSEPLSQHLGNFFCNKASEKKPLCECWWCSLTALFNPHLHTWPDNVCDVCDIFSQGKES